MISDFRESRGLLYAQVLKWLFFGWLGAYGLFLVLLLARPLGFFVISGFELAPAYEVQLFNALRIAFLWLLPTGLLAFAVGVAQGRFSAP